MRLVKLQDKSTRAITGLDLLMKFGFGNNIPTEFISGNTYEAGQYAYKTNDNGTFDLYLCVESGRYDNINNQGWTYASISSIVGKQSTDKVIAIDADSIDTGDIYDTVYYTLNNENVSILDEYIINVDMAYNDGDRIELYVNNKFISNQDWDIEPIKRNLYEIVTMDHVAITDLVIIHRKKKHVNANLIGYCELYPQFISINGSTFGELLENEQELFEGAIFSLSDDNIKSNRFAIDLFYKGKYISSDEFNYEFEDINKLIKLSLKKDIGAGMITTNVTDLTDMVIVITYSKSSQFVISNRAISQKAYYKNDLYRFDLVNISNRNIGNNVTVYSNGRVVPPNYYEISNLVLSITDEDYYTELSKYIVVNSKTFSVVGEYAPSGSLNKTFVEKMTIVDSLDSFCIPFVNWNADIDDVLVFKSSGVLINPNRYFIRNGYVVPYEHESLVSDGTKLEIHSINNDDSSFMYSAQTVITNVDYIKVPYAYYQKHLAMMIFNSAGAYIAKNKYTIDDNLNVIFNDKSTISIGEVLTFVFIDYRYETSYSMANIASITLSDNYGFDLPFGTYNPNRDHLIMFNDNGMYISTDAYNISDNRITLLNEDSFNLGSNVDIYMIRRYDNMFSVASIPELLKVF